MASGSRKPIFFLAFANDASKPLSNLQEEHGSLVDALHRAEAQGLCEVHDEPFATRERVFNVFSDPRFHNRIAVFHFGGHADEYRLLLESSGVDGGIAHASGLAGLLAEQAGLRLVFLNACATAPQARALLDANVPSIIATSTVIADKAAMIFARRFYRALADGAGVRSAYNVAESEVVTAKGHDLRTLYFGSPPADEDLPWKLHVRPGAEAVEDWNLPSAAAEPLFGLPALPDDLDPPKEPFVHLRPFAREDAPIFFGRGYEIRELYNRINDDSSAPIVLFYGPTGVGKSSILAAGLLPRLEASHDVRLCRRLQDGLTASLLDALTATTDITGIRNSWCEQEGQAGKLLVVIDQAEEAYTRQAVDEADTEVNGFLKCLSELFSKRTERPQGKLILSFREEWLARFEQRLDDAGLYYESQPLERLKPQGIVRAIEKPAGISRYRLHVEDDLPQIIADDLREDRESPLAPTLEVLLTRMWEEARTRASQQERRERRFDTDLYQSLKNQGYLLKDFLEQQLSELRASEPGAVDSGLALDILRLHITEMGTAAQHTAADVAELYQHQREAAQRVIKHCIDLRLLVDISNPQAAAPDSRLTHDSLAPLIRRRFDESDRPGQRALRILKNRAVDWREGKRGPVLGDADLQAVEHGQTGMRRWNEDELRLLEASRDRWAKQRAKRRAEELAVAANDALAIRKPQRALLLAAEAVREAQRQELRVARAEQALRNAQSQVSGFGLGGHDGPISCIAFSPNGRWLATSSDDTAARLWDLALSEPADNPIVLSGHESSIFSVAFSPDGRCLATGSWDGTVRFWDLTSPDCAKDPIVLHGSQETELRGFPDPIVSVAISPDGHWLATYSGDATAQLWDLASPDPADNRTVLRGHEEPISSVAFSPNGRWLATGSSDGTARLWDLASPDPADTLIVLSGHEEPISNVAFDPDGRWLATGGWDGTARLWDLTSPNPARDPTVLRGHEQWIPTVAFSPDGHWLATGSWDTTARLWDLGSPDPAENPIVLSGHEGPINSVIFSPDGRWLATGSSDGTARLWDFFWADRLSSPIVLRGHDDQVYSVAFSPDSRWLATGSRDNTARLWDLTTPDPADNLTVLRGDEEPINCVAFDPDGRWLATGSWDDTARLWDLASPNPADNLIVLSGHEDLVTCAAFSPNGRLLATGSDDTTARLWDLASPDPADSPIVLRGHEEPINCVAFSPDHRWLATRAGDHAARLWDLASPNPADNLIVLSGHEDLVTCAAFSPNGRLLATGSDDTTARLWDLASPDPADSPIVLRGHEEPINCVAFSPDHRWLATASDDTTARLWDLASPNPADNPIVLRGHEASIACVAFSPDNRWLASGSDDTTARLWDLASPDPAENPIALRAHESAIASVAFNVDNRWLATGSSDGTARLWDLKSSDPKRDPIVLRDHDKDNVTQIEFVAFSPDGHWLAAVGWGGTVSLWALSIAQLLANARHTLGRNATRAEWERYFPGEPYRRTFPDLPPGIGIDKQIEVEGN